MRLQPGLSVIVPADHRQAKNAIHDTWDRDGPIYYRIGKDDRSEVAGLEGRFAFGHNELVRDGRNLVLVSMGAIATEAVAAAEELDAAVLIVSTLSPSPSDELARELARFERVITIEAHYVQGGLGSLVAEVIAEQGLPCRLERCAVREPSDGRSGSAAYYRSRHGLSKDAIITRATAPHAPQ